MKGILSDTVSMQKDNSLRDNMLSLFLLQGANYVLPLLTVPYLVRVLGPEKFGLIAFAQAFIQYFVLLTDYGFNLSATRLISINRHDVEKRSQIFWSTTWAKVGLMFISLLVMTVIVFSFRRFSAEWPLYYLTFMVVAGNVLFPVWYFQGMERMKFVSALNIFIKTISVAAIFVFVHHQRDYILVAAIQASGMIAGGLLSIYFVQKIGPLQFLMPKPDLVVSAIKEGWHIFISSVGISLYVSSTAFVLGLMAGNVAVGYFSAAQKLINAAQGLVSPVSQAVYPRISALAAHSKDDAIRMANSVLIWLGTGTFMGCCLLFGLAGHIVGVVLGNNFQPSVAVVRWMAFIPFVVVLSNIFGVQILFTFGYAKLVVNWQIPTALISLLSLFIMIRFFGVIGAAVNLFVTELFITIGFIAISSMKVGYPNVSFNKI